MQDVSSGSYRVGTKEKLQSGFLGRSHQAVSSSGIAIDIPIDAFRFRLVGLDAVSCDRCMYIVSIIIAVSKDLDVGSCNVRLFGKFGVEHLHRMFKRAVKKPAHQSKRKHVLTLQDRLIVQSGVFEAVFAHRGYGCIYNSVVDA